MAKHRATRKPAGDPWIWSRVVVLPFVWIVSHHLAAGPVAQLLIMIGLNAVLGNVLEAVCATARQVRRRRPAPGDG